MLNRYDFKQLCDGFLLPVSLVHNMFIIQKGLWLLFNFLDSKTDDCFPYHWHTKRFHIGISGLEWLSSKAGRRRSRSDCKQDSRFNKIWRRCVFFWLASSQPHLIHWLRTRPWATREQSSKLTDHEGSVFRSSKSTMFCCFLIRFLDIRLKLWIP